MIPIPSGVRVWLKPGDDRVDRQVESTRLSRPPGEAFSACAFPPIGAGSRPSPLEQHRRLLLRRTALGRALCDRPSLGAGRVQKKSRGRLWPRHLRALISAWI